MTPQTEKQTNAKQILPSISRSKGNQTIKLDHSIEYNMSSIFLEKSFTKQSMEISHRPFYVKEPKLGISLDQRPEM